MIALFHSELFSRLILKADDEDDDEAAIRKASFRTVVLGAMAMALWGFSDSQIQAIAYWHLGTNYHSGPEQARGVSQSNKR